LFYNFRRSVGVAISVRSSGSLSAEFTLITTLKIRGYLFFYLKDSINFFSLQILWTKKGERGLPIKVSSATMDKRDMASRLFSQMLPSGIWTDVSCFFRPKKHGHRQQGRKDQKM